MKQSIETESGPLILRPINAQFRSRLPVIFERMNETLMLVEPELLKAQVHLNEFRDFLKFEISKIELEITRCAWESVIDMDKAKQDAEWLDMLQELSDDFKSEAILSSTTMMKDLYRRAKLVFDMPDGTGLV